MGRKTLNHLYPSVNISISKIIILHSMILFIFPSIIMQFITIVFVIYICRLYELIILKY